MLDPTPLASTADGQAARFSQARARVSEAVKSKYEVRNAGYGMTYLAQQLAW